MYQPTLRSIQEEEPYQKYEQALKKASEELPFHKRVLWEIPLTQRMTRIKPPQVSCLEEILENTSCAIDVVSSFQMDIYVKWIEGVYSTTKQPCFSQNYMPIVRQYENLDFVERWERLARNIPSWLDSGNRLSVVEFLHKYYVKEGNRRASVAKFAHLVQVPATVERFIPTYDSTDKTIRLYYEFLEFEKRTGLQEIWFSQEHQYEQLEQCIDLYTTQSGPGKYKEFLQGVYYPFKNAYDAVLYHRRRWGKHPWHKGEVGDVFLNYLQKVKSHPRDINPKRLKKYILSLISECQDKEPGQ